MTISNELKALMLQKAKQYNHTAFIADDPIRIPHQFEKRQDIEIVSFLTATIAWGTRAGILKSADKLIQLMGGEPYAFLMEYDQKQMKRCVGFVHRTFQHEDLHYFFTALKKLYEQRDSLEDYFLPKEEESDLSGGIVRFRDAFFSFNPPQRTRKHVSNPHTGSAAKRLHMMLRWLVRQDQQGVDLGIWTKIPMAKLSCPLDVHSGNVARSLGLLTRKQNDFKALKELDASLRQIAPEDPASLDFALFGMGVSGELKV